MSFASMAVIWQRLARQSHQNMTRALEAGNLKRAEYYQRQSAEDHRIMMKYLERGVK